jgi:hypothetical protein
MTIYNCPLCNQQVSKTLFEKITGIWQTKEKMLASLKFKEKELYRKAKEEKAKFEIQKRKLLEQHKRQMENALEAKQAAFQLKLKRMESNLSREKIRIESLFKKKLSIATNEVLKREKEKQKRIEIQLRQQFAKSSEIQLQKATDRLNRENALIKKNERLIRDKNEKLLGQFQSLQLKHDKYAQQANRKIMSLEEQLKKNQTPQMLGLLEEKEFLAKLKDEFPNDKFEHTGKGGDILHYIYDKELYSGKIVYELKKVAHFNKAHVVQAQSAKLKREADYGILITNAKQSKNDSGFSVSKGVIIIHPAGALVLIGILRDNLIRVSRLKLTKAQRDQTINAVLEYIQGPSFKNSLDNIIEDTIDLYHSLTKEVNEHAKLWHIRLDRYRRINGNASKIGAGPIRLLISAKEDKVVQPKTIIGPIMIPERIA